MESAGESLNDVHDLQKFAVTPYMTATLPDGKVTEFSQQTDQLVTADIPGQSHAAKTSSRTK
jgi:hypothetical protein